MNKQNKIMVVSVTKIESDIIESFVRYSLTFADEILIADNGSCDGANEILQRLREEGLPIHVKTLAYKVEFDHAKMMLDLVKEAAERYKADIILPSDIDEFLVNTENGTLVREILMNLDREKVYHVHMYQYALLQPYMDSMQFLLSQLCVREPVNLKATHSGKVIVGAGIVLDQSFRLIQGCHYAYRETSSGDESILLYTVPFLHFAHFHWRCNERYTIKSVLGWLGTASKYTIHAYACHYMKVHYDKIMCGEMEEYDRTMGEKATEAINLSAFCAPQKMRYGELARIQLLPIILKESERIAEAYVEEKVLRKKKTVDVFLPFWGDRKTLRNSLRNISVQTYPYIRTYILPLKNCSVQDIGFYDMPSPVVVLEETSRSLMQESLSKRQQGDYVQWLLPGSNLSENHIQEMVAAFEMQDYKFPLLLANPIQPYDAMRPYADLLGESLCSIFDRKQLWRHILVLGKYPANGMDEVLIPNYIMQSKGYLLDCLDEIGPRILSMWRSLLQGVPEDDTKLGVYVFRPNSSCIRSLSDTEYIRHQLEWMELLADDGAGLLEDEIKEALKRMTTNYHYFLSKKTSVDTELLQKYRNMMQTFESEFKEL